MNEELLARAARIRVLLLDVDGVLTDGTYFHVPDGNGGLFETKVFDSQDGIALHWLREAGIAGGVITGRNSPVVAERARSAGFVHVYQGHVEKVPILEEILYRGFLLGAAERCMSRRAALIVSAVAFACVPVGVASLLPMLAVGLLLGAIRVSSPSGSLLGSIVAHALFNLLTLTLLFATLA